MVIIVRSNDSDFDSRVQKYINFFNIKKIEFKIINWDRNGIKQDYLEKKYFKLKTKNNQGEKALFNRIKWFIYSLKQLFIERKNYKVIHCCDLDCVLPALFMKFFNKKIIFDIFDCYSDSLEIKNYFLKKIIIGLEKISIKYSDYVIICEPERKKQLNYIPDEILVLPNIPNSNIEKLEKKMNNEKIIICYIGTFYSGRNLDILLEAVKENKKIELYIGGFGDIYFEKLIKKYSKECVNIKYFGKVTYEEAIKLMNSSDILYAMYCKINKNHIYAAPNKFYESLMLAKPVITTEGTLIGKKVEKYRTGFIIGEKFTDTKEILEKIVNNPKILDEKKENCKKIWEKKYKNYVQDFFENIYYKKILKGL